MDRQSPPSLPRKALLSAVLLAFFFCTASHAAARLWTHGDRYDARESKSADAVAMRPDADGTSVVSVEIFPDLFSDTENGRHYLYGECDTLRHTCDGTAEIYAMVRDTLYWLGRESRATLLRPDSAVILCHIPMKTGENIETGYSGILGYWGNRPVRRVYGTSKSVISDGITLTADTDTLHDVTMLEWSTVMRMEPDTAHLNRGSLVFADDAVNRTSLLTRRRVFFPSVYEGQPGYPVLTVTDTYAICTKDETVRDTVALGSVSRWIPDLTTYASMSETAKRPAGHSPSSEAEDGYFPVRVESEEARGDVLAFSLSSTGGDETVTATVCTADGIVAVSPRTYTVTAIPSEHIIQIPPDLRGVILLRLESAEAAKTIRIIR